MQESPPPPPLSARKARPEPSASARKKREAARKQREREGASREGGPGKEVASREQGGSREPGDSPSRSVSTEPPLEEPQQPERLGRGQRAARGRGWRRRGMRHSDFQRQLTGCVENRNAPRGILPAVSFTLMESRGTFPCSAFRLCAIMGPHLKEFDYRDCLGFQHLLCRIGSELHDVTVPTGSRKAFSESIKHVSTAPCNGAIH